MDFRNKKGITGIDISIAVIAILIFIPTIFGAIYNIRATKSVVNRQAVSIAKAVEILEEAKGQNIDDVENYLKSKYTGTTGNGGFETSMTKNEVSYKIEVSYQNPSQYVEGDTSTYFVKKVIAKITYPTGNTTKTIEMSTILKKDIV